ncbi:CPBP family intramembrane glutamic endopeptidase [Aeromicrobium panaciterrae]|uniref:CPBP family intramembrane glutamic endopeptidase n=1 Tax=Aeromicrobium panaciterrae TaxID=363861 RepID=UPI0031D682A3
MKLTDQGIRNSTATLNGSQSDREWLDFTLQVLGIGFALVPVALALYLLSLDPDQASPLRRLGITGDHRGRDVLWGAGLAAAIGLPGLGLYAAGRALGITAEVIPSPVDQYWWTVPVLILSALQNAILEEVVVVGFVMTRLRQMRWNVWSTIVTSALIRGSYHLYQGFGQAFGNVVMGLVFGYFYTRTKRVLPLIVAHTIMDVVVFVGYPLLKDHVDWW